ncbi:MULTISPECIES: FecR domain-containing protein [Pseudomonas syringae group]|uniref:Putative Transmembrane sensor n=1 Tax=Pseudomonas syringae pv. castaneae TaxID=264450 RepID=A0A0P9MMT2_PSESX|nr:MULTISPECIES: FecR domain-containing protein [Pseudomonas syringae group]KPW93306.1 putative Transmembrane sensor [Pseudomonas syringae pv. castaneae]KWS91716.1 sugar ABC transporter substrate-binding protein [Pseudomonas syringae pv. castaneae]
MIRSAPSNEEREVVRRAAQWLALLESGGASEEDHAMLQHWRDSSASHERAWQKAQQLRQRFFGLPANLAMATLDRPDKARRAALKRALGAVALVPTAWLVGRQLPLDVWRADLQTSVGEHKRLSLADGSTLQLNTDSAVNVDLGARRVTLVRGEIALKVPGRAALTIEGPYGRVVVSQSEVCVRLNQSDCGVSVVSGAVQLYPLQGPVLALHAQQQVSLKQDGAGPVSAFDALLPGWRDDVLTAQNQSLGDFLRELGRYRPGLLRWEPALEALRVTGSFRLDNTDRVLSLLAASLPVDVQMRTRYWVTLVPRKNISTKNNA